MEFGFPSFSKRSSSSAQSWITKGNFLFINILYLLTNLLFLLVNFIPEQFYIGHMKLNPDSRAWLSGFLQRHLRLFLRILKIMEDTRINTTSYYTIRPFNCTMKDIIAGNVFVPKSQLVSKEIPLNPS